MALGDSGRARLRPSRMASPCGGPPGKAARPDDPTTATRLLAVPGHVGMERKNCNRPGSWMHKEGGEAEGRFGRSLALILGCLLAPSQTHRMMLIEEFFQVERVEAYHRDGKRSAIVPSPR